MTLLSSRDTASRAESSELRRWVTRACLAVVVIRLTYVFEPLRSDEGGYLLVARQWRTGGEFLYGNYHVDRPPLLLAIFKLAALTDWDPAIRVLSIPVSVLFVLAAARAGQLAAGASAARWSAVLAAALVSSPALAADQADGELFAVPFVMGSIALTLEAWHRLPGRPRFWLAVGAGVLASAAALVKQNFLEGFVFVGLLVLTEVLRRHRITPRSVTVAAGVALGAVLPHLVVFVWATLSGIGGLEIWRDVASFRGEAVEVIWSQSTVAPITRAVALFALALVSGVLPILVVWLLGCRLSLQRAKDETWALCGCVAFGVAAIVAGGSYWPHYLLQLAPALALVGALGAAAVGEDGARMRRWIRVSAGATALGCVVVGLVYVTVPRVWFQERTGEWLARSGDPGDTAFVAYGNPSVLEAADMDTPYPYLWSLPMRTADPTQERLRNTLAGPSAPTWIVEINRFNSWSIDNGGLLRALVKERYDQVETVCGSPVWLRKDAQRDLAPPPDC